MKTSSKTRKLNLSRETLKQLSNTELDSVAGGISLSYCLCPSKSRCWSIGDIC